MGHLKFDIAKLDRLNDPGRFETLVPEAMWAALGGPSEVRSIVEIGAGTGLFSAKFAELAADATVYAVDSEPRMIEWMRENRAEVASGRMVPVLSEEVRLPLEDGMADLVVTINIHHELANPAGTYAEARRILAPGGRILAVDWDARETPKGPPLSIRASAEDVAQLLTSAGFSAVCVHPPLRWHWMVTATRP